MLLRTEVVLRLYSPVTGRLPPLARTWVPLWSAQVRGKKQKFGEATRDPFKSLQRKLGREQQRKHAKVPLMSEERAQVTRLAPITASSIGGGCLFNRLLINHVNYRVILFCLHNYCVGQLVATYAPLEKFAKAPIYTRLVSECVLAWCVYLTLFLQFTITLYITNYCALVYTCFQGLSQRRKAITESFGTLYA